jgi:HTH-type transcriptional regulator / antitoxin HigA
MNLKPIKTEEDYEEALQEIERLWDAEPNTLESNKLEILATLVEVYEKDRYELPPPDPIAAIEYFIESRGWDLSELSPYIGGRKETVEILERKRPLTLPMIRRLSKGTGIPASILIQEYATEFGSTEAQDSFLLTESKR